MLGRIRNILVGDDSYAASAEDPEERRQLALAALLVEMARADFDESGGERAEISRLLADHFELGDDEAGALLDRAGRAMDDAVSLFDFTRALHESLDYEQKLDVIRLLWQVALSDDHLDRYEDYLLRKVGDLLYVSASDIIRLRNEARAARGNES